jgi:hypothetical protein
MNERKREREKEREKERNQPLHQHEVRRTLVFIIQSITNLTTHLFKVAQPRSGAIQKKAKHSLVLAWVAGTFLPAHWLRLVRRTSCSRAYKDLSLKKELETEKKERVHLRLVYDKRKIVVKRNERQSKSKGNEKRKTNNEQRKDAHTFLRCTMRSTRDETACLSSKKAALSLSGRRIRRREIRYSRSPSSYSTVYKGSSPPGFRTTPAMRPR